MKEMPVKLVLYLQTAACILYTNEKIRLHCLKDNSVMETSVSLQHAMSQS